MIIKKLSSANIHKEVRRFPRLPLSSLRFVTEGLNFEVVNLSRSGMQMHCPSHESFDFVSDNKRAFTPQKRLKGELRSLHAQWPIEVVLQWMQKNRIGVSFHSGECAFLEDFYSIPLHVEYLERAETLLQSDGPRTQKEVPSLWLKTKDHLLELFVYKSHVGLIQKIDVLIFDHLYSWEEAKELDAFQILKRERNDSLMHTQDIIEITDAQSEEKFSLLEELLSFSSYFEYDDEIQEVFYVLNHLLQKRSPH